MATLATIAATLSADPDANELERLAATLKVAIKYSLNARVRNEPHVWLTAIDRPGAPQLGEFPSARSAINFLQPQTAP